MLIRELLEQTDAERALASQATSWKSFLEAVPRLQTSLESLDQGVKIYRGLGHTNTPVVFKPQMHPGYRKSANIDNYYTLIIDNSPLWKNYPPRSASIIATTDGGYARNYGDLYLVLPQGDPMVGVCTAGDFWESFPHMQRAISELSTLEDLVFSLRNIFRHFGHMSVSTISNYDMLKNALHDVDLIWQEKKDLSEPEIRELGLYDSSIALLKYQPDVPMLDKLESLLDPRVNNFARAHWGNMDAYMTGDYEVWFSAPAWLLKADDLPRNLDSQSLQDYARTKAEQE